MAEPARREGGRGASDLRPVSIEIGAAPYAEGSCLIAAGRTRILCAASVLDEVPEWRKASGKGWVTAEYAMLPRSTHTRRPRDRTDGRTREIQRLIGRSLRAVVDLAALGPRTIVVDCDVLQADGGTRTASITGGWVALAQACRGLVEAGLVERSPTGEPVAAVSTGLVDGEVLLDLDYSEDSAADVDMNVVATGNGELVEVQATAEGVPFARERFDILLERALEGIQTLVALQVAAVKRSHPA